MDFSIVIKWNGKQYRARVSRTILNRTTERFNIIGRNKSVTIESNRPILMLKRLSSWEPTYKIISRQFHTPGFEKSLIAALHEGIVKFDQQQKTGKS